MVIIFKKGEKLLSEKGEEWYSFEKDGQRYAYPLTSPFDIKRCQIEEYHQHKKGISSLGEIARFV